MDPSPSKTRHTDTTHESLRHRRVRLEADCGRRLLLPGKLYPGPVEPVVLPALRSDPKRSLRPKRIFTEQRHLLLQ